MKFREDEVKNEWLFGINWNSTCKKLGVMSEKYKYASRFK